jgi:hypothetical protein
MYIVHRVLDMGTVCYIPWHDNDVLFLLDMGTVYYIPWHHNDDLFLLDIIMMSWNVANCPHDIAEHWSFDIKQHSHSLT